jgi:hypothetical protein
VSSYKSSKILLSVLVVLLIKGAVLQIIMVSTETDFLMVERPCLDSQVILYVYGSLYEDHSLIIEVVGNNFAMLTLVLKSGIFGFLLDLSFVDELFQISNLFAQVFIDVAALLFRHFQNCLTLRIQNLNVLLAQIQFLSGFIYFLLQVRQRRHKIHIILARAVTSVTRQYLLSYCTHNRLFLPFSIECSSITIYCGIH